MPIISFFIVSGGLGVGVLDFPAMGRRVNAMTEEYLLFM